MQVYKQSTGWSCAYHRKVLLTLCSLVVVWSLKAQEQTPSDNRKKETIAYLEQMSALPEPAFSSLSETDIIKLFQIALEYPQPRSSIRMTTLGLLSKTPYIVRVKVVVDKALPTLTNKDEFDHAVLLVFSLATPQGVTAMKFDKALLGNREKYGEAEERESVIQAWKQRIKTTEASTTVY